MTQIRPGSFQIMPPVIKNLIIINVLVFIAQKMFENSPTVRLEDLFALHDLHSSLFKPYQLLTHLFMHGGYDHIFFNMLALWMFGSSLENYWGSKRFLIFYIICGLGAAALHLGILYYETDHFIKYFETLPASIQNQERDYYSRRVDQATLGASGAVFGCLAAMGYLFPNSIVYVNFFIPVKVKWFVIFYGAMELWLGIRNSAGDNVAHWAHIGGAVVGLLLVVYWNRTNRRSFY